MIVCVIVIVKTMTLGLGCMKFFKFFIAITLLCAFIGLGAKDARSQVPCTSPAASTSLAFSIEWGSLAFKLTSSQSIIQAFYTMAEKAVQEAVTNVIDDVLQLGKNFNQEFMDFDLRPAMQDMTAELHTANTDASRAQGGCIDAQEFAKTTIDIKSGEVDAHRASRPSVLQCQAATITGGLYRQDTIVEAYARAAPIQSAATSGASTTTPAGKGDEVYLNSAWTEYCTRYVDPQYNNGKTGCPPGPPPAFIGENVNANNLFEDTYDVTDADKKKNLDDFIHNICGVMPIERAQLEEMATTEGMEVFVNGVSRLAQEQLCYTALYYIQSKRVPGSQMDSELLPHIIKGGVNPATVPANPSWTTIENIIEASTAIDFQTQLVDEPDAVERFLVVPDIYAKTFGVNEIKDMQERATAILAVLGARELGIIESGRKYDTVPR